MKRSIQLLLFLGVLGSQTLFAQVVNIEDQRITGTSDTVRWYGHLRGGTSFSKVKDQSLQLAGQVKVQYKSDPNILLLLANLDLLRAGKEDFSRQAFVHLRYGLKLNETWTWEAFVQAQTSPIQLLDQRNLVGTGVRWRLLKSKNGKQRIYLGIAGLYEQNRFTEPNGSSNWFRSSNYLSTTFRPSPHITLIQTTYWQPVLGYIHNYRLSSEWVLNLQIRKRLAYTVEFNYGIDKNLPPGGAIETYSWRNGLSFQL